MTPYVEWLKRQRKAGSARATDEALADLVAAGRITEAESEYIKGVQA